MELWLTFAALLAWQGLARVPSGGAAFVRFFGSTRILRRPGLTWLPPFGLEPSFVLPGVGLLATSERAYVPDRTGDREEELDLDDSLELSVQGATVRVDGKSWLRASSPEHSLLLAERLKRLAVAPPAKRSAVAWEIEREAFDVVAARETLRRVESSTWILGSLTTAEVLAVAIVPFFLSSLGSEGGLRVVLPGLGVLHGLAWLALLYAEWRLGLSGRGERLAVAALYPPALLYAGSALHTRALLAFHPLAVAPALARERDVIGTLQRAYAEAATPPFDRHGGHDVSEEATRRARWKLRGELLRTLAEASEIDPARLSAAPDRVGPVEDRFCPICRDAFRAGFSSCPDCGVATRPFA
ncbi:MAG: hypothetical protein QNK05_14235 [Myxococcota bacterium]|nr:hypothetical protein [Myxococcota bacterium]